MCFKITRGVQEEVRYFGPVPGPAALCCFQTSGELINNPMARVHMRMSNFLLLVFAFFPASAFASPITLKILKPASGKHFTLGEKVTLEWEIQGLPAKTDDLELLVTDYDNNLYAKNGVSSYQLPTRLPHDFDIFHDVETKQVLHLTLKEPSPSSCPPDADCLGKKKTLAEAQVEIVVSLPKIKNGKACNAPGEKNLQIPHGSYVSRCGTKKIQKVKSKDEAAEKECRGLGMEIHYFLCHNGDWLSPR